MIGPPLLSSGAARHCGGAVRSAMWQIQLPMTRAPRGAITKIGSNVLIVVAISYSSPHHLRRGLLRARPAPYRTYDTLGADAR
jgi:hypothetical protein